MHYAILEMELVTWVESIIIESNLLFIYSKSLQNITFNLLFTMVKKILDNCFCFDLFFLFFRLIFI